IDIKFSFLEYAIENVLYYTNIAERSGINQISFFQSFKFINWIKLDNLFEKHEVYKYILKIKFLYILTERNITILIKIYSFHQSYFEIEDKHYKILIFTVLTIDSKKVI